MRSLFIFRNGEWLRNSTLNWRFPIPENVRQIHCSPSVKLRKNTKFIASYPAPGKYQWIACSPESFSTVFWPQIKLFRQKLMKTSDLQVCLLIQSDTNCNFKFKIRLNERKSIVKQTQKNEIQKKLLIKQIIYKHILATDTSCSM